MNSRLGFHLATGLAHMLLMDVAFASDTSPLVEMPVAYSAVTALPTPEADATVPYGDDPLQTLLKFDTQNPGADLVLIHGGCWSADYDRDHAIPLAAALRDQGFRVWLPEYRRVGDAGGGWPGSWDDIRLAIAYAAGESDGRPVIALGHSAGGHLALLAAARGVGGLDAVIGLAPITDLEAYAAAKGSCPAMTARFMGAAFEAAPEAYREASPAGQTLQLPTIIVQGLEDPIVPVAQAEAMTSPRVDVPGAGHFDLIHPGTAAFPLLLNALDSLLR
jgi:acetyl esterase/lipase